MSSSLKLITNSLWTYFTGRKSSWKFARGCLVIGGALLVGPLWLPISISIIESNYGIVIKQPSYWLGLAVIVIGLVSILIPEIFEHISKQTSERGISRDKHIHDKKFAQKIVGLCPQEKFDWFIHIIGDTHTMRERDLKIWRELEAELLSDETGFIDEETQAHAKQYQLSITSLLNFSAQNFFPPDSRHIRNEFWMFPAGNWDRGTPTEEQSKRYGALQRELNELLDDLENSRKVFLEACRQKLLLI